MQCAFTASAAQKISCLADVCCCPVHKPHARIATTAGVQVGVEKVTLNGRIRLTLKPLMDEMPIVAATQVSPQLWLATMMRCKIHAVRPTTSQCKGSSYQGVDNPDVSQMLARMTVLHSAFGLTIQWWELLCRICSM